MPILNNDMMRRIIMDHASNPTYKKDPPSDKYIKVHMHSDNCIDDLDINLLIENDVVIDACFNGIACTISLSSTDIMCGLVIGKNKNDALYMIDQYKAMLHEEPFDENVLDEAIVFVNTSKQAARIRCALIGWDGAEKILKDKDK